jgi:DNA mismatch repair protein MutS2
VRQSAEQSRDAAHLDDAARAARQRVERRIEALTAAQAAAAEPTAPPPDLNVGVNVQIAATGAEGRVVEIRDDRVMVEIGGLRLQVPASGLNVVAEKKAQKPRVRSTPKATYSMPDFEPSSEVDLRGLRAEEVESRLQPALDAAIQAALPELRIIHGKGTGALREVVAELLRSDPRIGSFRPGGIGEGGSGVTVVELR